MVQGVAALIASITLGTRKNGFSASGAAASTASAMSHGPRHVLAQLRVIVFGITTRTRVQHLGHRLDVADVDLIELVDVAQDSVELATIGVNLLGRQPEMGQLGNSQHFFAANFHGFDLSAPCVRRSSLPDSVTGRRDADPLFSWCYVTFYSAHVSSRIPRAWWSAPDAARSSDCCQLLQKYNRKSWKLS